ncbi:FAD-dependent oxidoreductase [Legionella dresdenensis]|uniref:FAD-dependent oxidoreductase n=1 Tax=Legionella dresdenensis TaxID=450200 RepID=A0ABV8CGC4_9GAMM
MMKIAIVGCGIAGPAAALFARQLDAEVTIFDKVENLKPVGAGFLLQPAGLHVLNKLQLAETLLTKGVPIARLLGINHKNKTVLDLKYSELASHHTGLGMHRAILYEEMYKKMLAADVTVINPCEIVVVDNGAEAVILTDRNGQQHGPYDCVVIADGWRSQLRDNLGLKVRVKPYPWGALWAIGQDREQRFSNVLEQVYKHTEIMAGILPMGHQDNNLLVSFFWSIHKDRLSHWQQTPFERWKQEVLTIWPKLASLCAQFNSHNDFAFARYSDVCMYPWHNNRVVVIGDAAHGMSPQLGQGANLGLIDALVLFECLSKYPLLQEALSNYTARRKRQLAFYQTASRFVTPWFQSSSFCMGLLRDLMHDKFCKAPVIKQQMLLTLACMKTGYFSSLPKDRYAEDLYITKPF